MLKVFFLMLAVAVFPAVAQQGRGWGGCCGAMANQQSEASAPIASNPVVEFTGEISQVQLGPGPGMSSLEVRHGTEKTKVYLGPVRYLIAENFNPKAGDPIEVKGYKQGDAVIAIQATLTKEKKTLEFRDAKGWPLWRGGPWRGGRGRMGGGPPGGRP